MNKQIGSRRKKSHCGVFDYQVYSLQHNGVCLMVMDQQGLERAGVNGQPRASNDILDVWLKTPAQLYGVVLRALNEPGRRTPDFASSMLPAKRRVVYFDAQNVCNGLSVTLGYAPENMSRGRVETLLAVDVHPGWRPWRESLITALGVFATLDPEKQSQARRDQMRPDPGADHTGNPNIVHVDFTPTEV